MAYVDEGPRRWPHDPARPRRADVGLPVPPDAADAARRRATERSCPTSSGSAARTSRPHARRLHLRRSRRLAALVRRAARPPGHRAVRPGLGWPDRAARRRRAPGAVRPPRRSPTRSCPTARRPGRASCSGRQASQAMPFLDAGTLLQRATLARTAERRRGRRLPRAVPRRGVHGRGAAVPAARADRVLTIRPCRPTGRRGRCSSGGSGRCSRCGRPTTSSSAERRTRSCSRIPGAAGQPHQTFSPAGHFIQDDVGEQLAAAMVDWLKA